MKISKELAQSIVFEMKKIIEKDLNFIDTNGIIIASTDSSRVGKFHAGGVEAIKKDGIVVIDWEEQYRGAKKGINIPIKFLGESVAVIGISGERDEVEKYAIIIKKMAEILIKESYFLNKRDEEEEYDRNILETLIYSKDLLKLKNLEAKIKNGGQILILKVNNLKEKNEIKNVFRKIREKIKTKSIYMMLKDEKIIIFISKSKREDVELFLDKLEVNLKNLDIKIGIGKRKENIDKIKISYNEAKKALSWSEKIEVKKVYYEDLLLEILINNLPEEDSSEYKEKVIGNLTLQEREEYLKIILLYEKYNGSLNKISKELYCHTNTLQYKLNKFYEKTGYDIRKYKDFVIIKLSFLL